MPNINRTDTTGFYNNTFEYYLNSWTRYRVTVEYVSGAVSSNRVYTCLAFQGYNEDGGRDYVDVQTTYRNNTEVAVAAELLTVSFEISAVNDNKMVLWSQIYLKNLADALCIDKTKIKSYN